MSNVVERRVMAIPDPEKTKLIEDLKSTASDLERRLGTANAAGRIVNSMPTNDATRSLNDADARKQSSSAEPSASTNNKQ